MILMRAKLKNLLIFDDFDMCTSYPKKIVDSSIAEEHLEGFPYFRYKKAIVLMGANATGKTALGRVLGGIFNFIYNKEYQFITSLVEDKRQPAFFAVDLVLKGNTLCRVETTIKAKESAAAQYSSEDIQVAVSLEPILKMDSYERCANRLSAKSRTAEESYITELEKVKGMSWMFEYPRDSAEIRKSSENMDMDLYVSVLEKTLKLLDPRIVSVVRVPETENTCVILYRNQDVILKDGRTLPPFILSGGTAEGIGIAEILASMKMGLYDFYYCDEKFSHIHSDMERAFLSVFVDLLGKNRQLIFTTHNTDVLEMDLPKHSFAFLKRTPGDKNTVSCVFASDYIKKAGASLKNAVENDLFSSAPVVDGVFDFVSQEAAT